ncbi:MAG: energy transducer TonB [Pseudomonadales bacterium]
MSANVVRFGIGSILAAFVTVGLLVIMYSLIAMSDVDLDGKKGPKIADITMPDVEIDVNVAEVKPDKPEDPDEPPPELDTPQNLNVQVDTALNVNFTPKADIKIGSGGLSVTDGEYLPIVKVAPIYPNRANSRGVEGYCIVEYTVTKAGTTRDVVPTDCQPSGYFEKASVKAAGKFKYKPRVVDGEPIEVGGVQNKFTYQLEK